MKRIVAIILFFLYVIPAIGINISVHYCGGEISSVSFGSGYVEKCACGSKKMKTDCCKNKQISFKLKSDQQKTSHVALNFFKSVTFLPIVFSTYSFSFQPAFDKNIAYNDYQPPDKLKQPLYILHRVFRI